MSVFFVILVAAVLAFESVLVRTVTCTPAVLPEPAHMQSGRTDDGDCRIDAQTGNRFCHFVKRDTHQTF